MFTGHLGSFFPLLVSGRRSPNKIKGGIATCVGAVLKGQKATDKLVGRHMSGVEPAVDQRDDR
jgi:hypothetical protein